MRIGGGPTGTTHDAATTVYSLIVDNNNNVYVTNYDGQIYYSKQGITAWITLGNTESSGYVDDGFNTLAVANNTVYMVSSGDNNNIYAYNASTMSWRAIGDTSPVIGKHPLFIVDADKSNNIYTSNFESQGLWVSAKGQSQWQKMFTTPSVVRNIAAD